MDRYPVRVEAHRDESLSRGLWLVKWILLIPHYLALAVLWTGLVVLTLVAYLAVLFTGRYPEPIRAYDIGVLRWTWRVGYYGYQALGTDRYPPFTLADVPGYPARFRVDAGPPPPRWLPLVAWLLAVPHLILLGALTGSTTWSFGSGDARADVPLSLVGAAVLVAGVALLFTGRYPAGLHDLLVGVARWGLRVTAYLTLLTGRYPPFRLDQGGNEPEPEPEPDIHAAPPGAIATRSATGSVVALIAGVLLLAPAAGLGVGGGLLLALDAGRDRDGYVTSPVLHLSSGTAAVTAENLEIADPDRWTGTLTDAGGLRVTVTSPADRPLFVGVAPQADVDAWLAGTAHDELTGVTDGTGRYDRQTGAVAAVPGPAAQPFWLASASGTGRAELQWDVVDGEYAVVVANADGSPGIAADARGAVQLPDLTALGGGLLTVGIVLGLIAIGLIVLGGVGLGRRHTEPPPGVEPPAPAPRTPPVPAGR
jgi:uncharacterized protein DUF4389